MPYTSSALNGLKGRSPYNIASGGTENTYTNYNGTGQTWKTHTFTGNGTFSVTKASQPFRVLTVGGGGAGGCGGPYYVYGGRGGRGQPIDTPNVTVPQGSHSVTVGGQSGSSSLASYQSSAGGGGGGDYGYVDPSFTNGAIGSPDYSSIASTITNASVNYSAGVGSPDSQTCLTGGGGPAYGGAGGGGGGNSNELCGAKCGGGGASGVVIIAYRVA